MSEYLLKWDVLCETRAIFSKFVNTIQLNIRAGIGFNDFDATTNGSKEDQWSCAMMEWEMYKTQFSHPLQDKHICKSTSKLILLT